MGNFSGESDFLEQNECMAGNPRVYGQLVGVLSKYSKFASAGDKAGVRQSTLSMRSGPKAEANTHVNANSGSDTAAESIPASATDASTDTAPETDAAPL